MPRVQFFSIPADDPARAQSFYRDVFGWQFRLGWEYDTPDGRQGYWEITTGPETEPGINGGLTKKEFPGQPINVGIAVPNIDDYLARIESRGGKVVVSVTQLPDKTRFAVCQDSEGNVFAIVEPSKKA